MAETQPGAAQGVPPEDIKDAGKQTPQKKGRGNLTLVEGTGAGKDSAQKTPPAEEKPRVKIPLRERIMLLRAKIVSSALSGARRAASLLMPRGAGLWIIFAIVSALIFFGSLQFAGVFSPKTFVAGTVNKARKIEVKDKLKGKVSRAVQVAKGGFQVIGKGLSQLKKIPAFFAGSYQNYKSWKKQREMDMLARWGKKLRFDQQKLNEAQKGLEKQKTNLSKQEDEIKSGKIKISQEEQRLVQFREELKKKEKELIKKQQQKEETNVTAEKKVAAGEKTEAVSQKENLAQIERLADIYRNMPPDQAADIVKEIDDDLVIAIFSQMKERNVARIMGEMEPQKAAELTKKMSGMSTPSAAPSAPVQQP